MADDDINSGFGRDENVEVTDGATEFDRLAGIVVDGVVGAAGGFVGTSVLLGFLIVASRFGAFDLASFDILASFVAADLVFPNNVTAIGFVVFAVLGIVPWPLLFASLGWYLPGDRFAIKGLTFGAVLWTGFAVGFYQGNGPGTLALYLVLTFAGHLGYGFALGLVFDYFSKRPDTLV